MNSLAKIKQVLNSMESQVEGNDVDELQTQITDLAARFRDNHHAASLLKMVQAVARYLATHVDNAHAESVPVLRLLVEQLETLVQPSGVASGTADGILARAVQTFKELKSKIAAEPLVSEKEIQELKANILSIDWEISDATLENFDAVVNRLMVKVKSNKVHFSFLKIIYSIGGYVARNKADAHKNSIGRLRSVFQNYEYIVQNPGMAADEKKQMLEREIRGFHEFKRELARSPGRLPAQQATDEEVMPALSHVKASPSTAHLVPLSKLSEQEISPAPIQADGEITPALAGRKKPLPDSRSMMDDLFTAKGSDSDDLLDAIHLGGISGSGPEQGMEMFEAPDGLEPQEGVKRFNPQRGSREPIPEIESRLDEFFNLDLPEEKTAPSVQGGGQQMTGDPDLEVIVPFDPEPEVIVPFDPDPEAIVPFQYEDEIFVDDENETESENEQDQPPAILQRLKTTLNTPDALTDQAAFTKFTGGISLLSEAWQGDSDKVALLELLASLAWQTHALGKDYPLESLESPDAPPAPVRENLATEGDVDCAKPPARGRWAKIKSIFGNH